MTPAAATRVDPMVRAAMADFAPPPDLLPSEWVEAGNIVLPPEDNDDPGVLRLSRTPYARGVMDTVADPHVEYVTFVTGTQVCKTTIMVCLAGYYTDHEPSPIAITFRTQATIKEFFANRFRRLVEQSRGFSKHLLPGLNAAKGLEFQFERNTIYGLWAGSEARLASIPIRILFPDEIDKYPPGAWQKAEQRTSTFAARKIFCTSTPKFEHGPIWQRWLASLQHIFYVPCPHCTRYQELIFRGDRTGEAAERLGPHWGVKFPEGERDPLKIDTQHLAWYECEHCGGRIENHQKPWMLLRGVWLPAGDAVRILSEVEKSLAAVAQSAGGANALGGRVIGTVADKLGLDIELPWASHIGFRLSGMYSPFHARSWWKIAAEFLRAQHNPELLGEFVNDWQARPRLTGVTKVDATGLRDHIGAFPKGSVPQICFHPDGADEHATEIRVLTAGIDVQSWGYYVVVWGWGLGGSSRMIYEAEFDTWKLTEAAVFTKYYPLAHSPSSALPVSMVFLDSGWDTDNQYAHARAHMDMCRAIKGEPAERMQGSHWRVRRIDKKRDGKPILGGLSLVHVNTGYYADALLIHAMSIPMGNPGDVEFHAGVSDEFLLHLGSHKKMPTLNKRTGRIEYGWQADPPGAADHYRAAALYGIAAGDFIQARFLSEHDMLGREQKSKPPPTERRINVLKRWRGVRPMRR